MTSISYSKKMPKLNQANASILIASFSVMIGQASAAPVTVESPSRYSYEENSVRQQKIRGQYGRYITFTGRTINSWEGTPDFYNPGYQGSFNCSTYGNIYGYTYGQSTYGQSTTCSRSGYVPPSYIPGTSGGTENKTFRYQLDCRDMTFDRKGDRSQAGGAKGWMNVFEDPTAQAVADRYCPIISTLPKAS